MFGRGLKARLYKHLRGFELYNLHKEVRPCPFYCAITVSVNGEGGGAWPEMRRTFRSRSKEEAEAKADRWIAELQRVSTSDRKPVHV